MSLTFDNSRALWLLLVLPLFYLLARASPVFLPMAVRRAAIALRLAIVTLLILTLAQPILIRPSDRLSAIFLVDHSASVSAGGESTASSWLSQALKQAGPRDQTGIIDFGSQARVARPLGVAVSNAATKPSGAETNIAAAIHLAMSLFPPTGAKRIVLLSDGQDNAGDALAAARQASVRHVQIDVVPIGAPANLKEMLVVGLDAPPYLRRGQEFDLGATVQSSVDSNATLQFSMDGKVISTGTVHVRPGSNHFSVRVTPATNGFHTYHVAISSPNDTYSQNNFADAYSVVGDPGHYLVVTTDPSKAQALVKALRSSGMTVDQATPSSLPPNLTPMKKYDGMALVDVPAKAMTLDQMKTVVGFAQTLGRGLLVVGGSQAFSLGGYAGTPLAAALPVDSNAPGNLQSGSVAMALVIDKSGSMDQASDGVSKMQMADTAAQLAVDVLTPSDQIAVSAFDTDPSWIVPLQTIGSAVNRKQIEAKIGQIQASGGTEIYTALKQAYESIRQSRASYKHIILLSDGRSLTDSNYNQLLAEIRASHITLSTIAIGSDSDTQLMAMLAQLGGGRYYYTDKARDIPQITTRETRLASGSSSVNEPFQPLVASLSPLLASVVAHDLPKLSGYDVTAARDSAQVALMSDRHDPILAHWQYGLGRVAVWTPDLTSRWAGNWLTWPGFTRFWGQIARWTLPAPNDPNVQMTTTIEPGGVLLKVDVVDDAGVFRDLLDLRARILAADGKQVEIPLVQTRPGRYEAHLNVDQPGAYPVAIVQNDVSGTHVLQAGGIIYPYPAEYRFFGINQSRLTQIAAATGGSVLHTPADSYSANGIYFDGLDRLPLWPWLLVLAVLLFPIDVAIRRLRLAPSKVAELIARVAGSIQGGAGDLGRALMRGPGRMVAAVRRR